MSGIFIFVACGADEHITTLNFALGHLRCFSGRPVIVITDSRRNTLTIEHDNVVDVQTPEALDHHQASIYLKTAAHRFVPVGHDYCYLDTDVLAVSDMCDGIFREVKEPVRFAPDHCRMPRFSAHAVNCNCAERWSSHGMTLQSALALHDRNQQLTDPEILGLGTRLKTQLALLDRSLLYKAGAAVRYLVSWRSFNFNDEFAFDKRQRVWRSKDGREVLFEVNVKAIERETGFKYDRWSRQWTTCDGESIWKEECDHLREAILRKFGIRVKERDWQHWNGGVFLFNDQSHAFLESWHRKTMEVFNDPFWKTRDQGTLIATAWEFGLENHPVLDKKWNFLADFNNSRLQLRPETSEFTDDGWQTSTVPALVHIYHHFGDEDWPIWNWVAGTPHSGHPALDITEMH
jgi:hypothetical protein